MNNSKIEKNQFQRFYRLVQAWGIIVIFVASLKEIEFQVFSLLMGFFNAFSYSAIFWMVTEPILQIIRLLSRLEDKNQKILQDLETKNTLLLELLDKVNYPTTLYR